MVVLVTNALGWVIVVKIGGLPFEGVVDRATNVAVCQRLLFVIVLKVAWGLSAAFGRARVGSRVSVAMIAGTTIS
jgi:hypothetical protein